MHLVLNQVFERAKGAREDSDFSYFFALLLAGEALTKTVALGLVAAVGDDKDRTRYRLEHALVHADGIGGWVSVIDDALTGPGAQFLLPEALGERNALTALCKSEEWQHRAVSRLKDALDCLRIEAEEVPIKTDLRRWFRLFARLRNQTRGHGAMTPAMCRDPALHLAESLRLVATNFSLLERDWAYLYRNLSGKYRVSLIAGTDDCYGYLKRESTHLFPSGVYVWLDKPRLVPLMTSEPELRDFFFANGGVTATSFEMRSYATDNKQIGDLRPYRQPPGSLPVSETHGLGELEVRGKCFSNAPTPLSDYVSRPKLQEELFQRVMDDRHPIITLIGSGGVGKTSLAIHVIDQITKESRFEKVVWLSARDVDLMPTGPKQVKPDILTIEDIGSIYAGLVKSVGSRRQKGFSSREFMEGELNAPQNGTTLFVFDNFETTQNPVEVYAWIDTYIRVPNKVLITTRLRAFKGDFPVEVSGMTRDESRELVGKTANYLGIGQLLTPAYVEKLIEESEGHPYVIKILLGDVAAARTLVNVRKVVAARDEVLTALFERTFGALRPCAQRAFMTLSAWHSAVPRLALEAVLLKAEHTKQDVEESIDSLLNFSMAESSSRMSDSQEFIAAPLVARLFGRKKLQVSPFSSSIQKDVEMLQLLGPSKIDDVNLGLSGRIETFIRNIAKRMDDGESFEDFQEILEMICRGYDPGWLVVARWHIERGKPEDLEMAKNELKRFLENNDSSAAAVEAWSMLAHVCFQTRDVLGEVHARMQRGKIPSEPFSELSNTANFLNKEIHNRMLVEVVGDEYRELAGTLLEMMETRKAEADGTDFSRMGWLAVNSGRSDEALSYARAGLDVDPFNEHCQRLYERFRSLA